MPEGESYESRLLSEYLVVIGLALLAAFIAGVVFGATIGKASNPYLSVMSSYVDLHWVHRREAFQLTNVMEALNLPVKFTSEMEQMAMHAGLSAGVSSVVLALGWRQLPRVAIQG